MQSLDMTEQIETLKQHVFLYAEDFANERADRERIQEALEQRFNEFEREIALWNEQVDFVDFTSIYSWL